MNEHVGRIVNRVENERPFASRSTGIIAEFLAGQEPLGTMPARFGRVPGAAEARARIRPDGGSGGASAMGRSRGIR